MNELIVVDAGALCTVQDLGRAGWAHLGVPRSGAMDRSAHALANRLVGNDVSSATVETTLTGCAVRFAGAARIAVSGAGCEVWVDERPVPWGAAVSVAAGSVLRLGPALAGVRSHLAVAGGVAVEQVLGSRSTDVLSGLGPAPLREGDVLPIGCATPQAAPWVEVPWPVHATVFDVVSGPRTDWFVAPSAIEGQWAVRSDSNRIGVRLEGTAMARRRLGVELESEPMVRGAIQVPPSGQPVVLMADHATTGGYPVIGVLRDPDGLAQVRPGEQVTLRLVG